jgi:hypothetical protein
VFLWPFDCFRYQIPACFCYFVSQGPLTWSEWSTKNNGCCRKVPSRSKESFTW